MAFVRSAGGGAERTALACRPAPCRLTAERCKRLLSAGSFDAVSTTGHGLVKDTVNCSFLLG